jgi:hypothetical protein
VISVQQSQITIWQHCDIGRRPLNESATRYFVGETLNIVFSEMPLALEVAFLSNAFRHITIHANNLCSHCSRFFKVY